MAPNDAHVLRLRHDCHSSRACSSLIHWLACSIARALRRSIACLSARSLVRSVDRSVACSLAREQGGKPSRRGERGQFSGKRTCRVQRNRHRSLSLYICASEAANVHMHKTTLFMSDCWLRHLSTCSHAYSHGKLLMLESNNVYSRRTHARCLYPVAD